MDKNNVSQSMEKINIGTPMAMREVIHMAIEANRTGYFHYMEMGVSSIIDGQIYDEISRNIWTDIRINTFKS